MLQEKARRIARVTMSFLIIETIHYRSKFRNRTTN